jgi:hypothetical protein
MSTTSPRNCPKDTPNRIFEPYRVTANTPPHGRRGTSRDNAASHSRSAGW